VEAGAFVRERGDDPPVAFSFSTERIDRPQIDCFLLHTTDRVHALVREHLDKSPLFNGQIRGIGPRYCRRWRTRSSASRPGSGTRSSWSPRGWTHGRST
jgi:tRNA U34 5-carboxymethylaminomethyl modifying enzyme MnmG/GidA